MNRRRKHRSCLCEVLLLRILKQQKTLTVLQKHCLKNQTRTEKQITAHNCKKTATLRKLQKKENCNGKQNFAHYLTLQGSTQFQV